jgi:peptidyl-prolyl cis-trans isomerase C
LQLRPGTMRSSVWRQKALDWFLKWQRSRSMRWTREPLLHFVVVGLSLFAINRLVGSNSGAARSSRIDLTRDDISQLRTTWMAQWQRPPTASELHGLIDARIREEVLYREALALGLDQGDTIVKRRLAQKMEFLAGDTSAIAEPRREQLRTWFEENRQRFAQPSRLSFRHLYFSSDHWRGAAHEAALQALGELTHSRREPTSLRTPADPFMFLDYYSDQTPDQVASIFGSEFADAVFRLEAEDAWQGPIKSGYGWHLVRVDGCSPERVPSFEEVESSVKQEWTLDELQNVKRRAFEEMKAHYEIVLP